MTKPVDYLKSKAPGRPVADILAELFRKRILDGEYLPGMRMIETEITQLYGVSRGPVREAFRKLIAEGLLVAEKHKSPVVRGVGKEQFYQMFEVRSVLEGLAARIAAGKMHEPDKRAWVDQQIAVWNNVDSLSGQAFVDANTLLHDGLRDLIDNQVLEEQIHRIAIPGFKAVFGPTVTRDDIDLSARQHMEILQAIRSGEGAKAERAMISHVMDTADRVTSHFSDSLFDRRLRELEKLKSDTAPS